MQTTQEVIYRAANLEQANLLKNLLGEQGIEAYVTNAMLQQAAGDLPFGGPIEPRVVVDAGDAAEARRIAIDFDRVVAPKGGFFTTRLDSRALRVLKVAIVAYVWFIAIWFAIRWIVGMQPHEVAELATAVGIAALLYVVWLRLKSAAIASVASPEELEDHDSPDSPQIDWPTCPECSRRRITSCPVCETSGTDFPRAFMPGAADESGEGPTPAVDKLFVLCTICDEPYAPQFPSRCEWCGHQFADGRELVPRAQASELEMDPRAWIIIVGLVAVLAGLALSFLYIARG